MELYCTPKSQYTTVKTQSETLGTHVHVRPARSRNTNSYRILPTGPLVAIFQHSLQFLQSEGFQTHVGTIHRRAIGPLALHNGISAYTSLTRHFSAPTIECLRRPPYKLTCSSHNFRYKLSLPTSKVSAAKYTRPHPTDLQTRPKFIPSPVSIEISVYCCQHNTAACLHCCVTIESKAVYYCHVSKETSYM
jgi:hypothetical protein